MTSEGRSLVVPTGEDTVVLVVDTQAVFEEGLRLGPGRRPADFPRSSVPGAERVPTPLPSSSGSVHGKGVVTPSPEQREGRAAVRGPVPTGRPAGS